ncbi:RICIN domain-containing protein [Streptomyces sp. NPDC054837]
MRRRIAATMAAIAMLSAPLLTGSALTGTASAAETAEAVTNARLYNMATGLCVANPLSDQDQGTVMFQYTCSNSDSNYWSLQPMTGGGYHVINKASGQCLAIPGGVKDTKLKAIQWPCQQTQNDEQVWYHDELDQLRNAKSGLCLAILGSDPTPKVQVGQWTCDALTAENPNPDRQWLW